MNIYIASSWKNQHAVEMLTEILEQRGHHVISFVRAAVSAEGRSGLRWDVEKWIESDDGRKKFEYDIEGATGADLVIYVGPSGTDAWAEVGAAYGAGVTIFGLWAKGEQIGLMRRVVQTWFSDYRELIEAVEPRDGEILAAFHCGEDLLADFIDECCVVDPEVRLEPSVFYDSFKEWYQKNTDTRVPGRAWFARNLSEKFQKDEDGNYSVSINKTKTVRTCRVCGCTDDRACPGGCFWVDDPQGGDLCSRCAPSAHA